MKVRKVNRYYCDFCKKANCSASSISRHESACTKNPNRACRMCAMLDLEQPKMKDLLRILPNPKKFSYEQDGTKQYFSNFWVQVEKAMPALRKKTNNCPACILAALRQKGIPVLIAESFNFTEECEAWWSIFNDQYNYDHV